MDEERTLREQICQIGARLWERNLIGACEGNISVRLGDNLLITPSGVCKGTLVPESIVRLTATGQPETSSQPTSELGLHLTAYQFRPDCRAVVHAHPLVATSLSLSGTIIPDDVLPESAYVLGPVAHLPFAFPGSREVSDTLEKYIETHKTFLLSHHGAMTLGKDLWDACDRMETLERVATMIYQSKLLGSVLPMPPEAFQKIRSISFKGSLS